MSKECMFQKIPNARNSLFQGLELFVPGLGTLCSKPRYSLFQELEVTMSVQIRFLPKAQSAL